MITDNNGLLGDDFNFGTGGEPVEDFFSQEDVTQGGDNTDVKTVIDQITKDEIPEGDDKDKDVTPKGDETNFFEEEAINTPAEEDKNKPEVKDDVEAPNVFLLNQLKERGIIDYELEEGEELTDDLAEELIEDKLDEIGDNKIKELVSDLSDDKKQAVQFLLKGGDLNQLVSAFSNTSTIDINTDLEKEDNQIAVMKKLLSLEDKDDEEVETEIEYLKDSGKLKAMAEKKLNKYKAEFESKQASLVEEQNKAKLKEKEDIKEAKLRVTKFLAETKGEEGITFSKEDKKDLPSFMNDKVVKLQNGTYITEMQKQMFYDLPKNEKALIQLATLLKNRNSDGTFNFDKIAKSEQTKVTRQVKDEIRRNKSSIPGSSTNNNTKSDKSLSDYFN